METEATAKPDLTTIVNDCMKLREDAAARVMTIPDAIAAAQWIERTPDAIVDPTVAKDTIRALHAALQRSHCYYNALKRGQEVFVLVQQDRAAPLAIVTWAQEASEHGCADAKIDDAYRLAARWRAQPESKTKWPT